MLLDAKIDISARSNSPLIIAVDSGNIDMVKLLLEYNANPYARNMAAFKISCSKGYIEIAKLLVMVHH